MSPRKLLIETFAVVLLVAPMALAEETASAPSAETAAEVPADTESEGVASPDDSGSLADAEPTTTGAIEPSEATHDSPPANQDQAVATPDAATSETGSSGSETDAIAEPEAEGLEAEPESDSVPAAWEGPSEPATWQGSAEPEMATREPGAATADLPVDLTEPSTDSEPQPVDARPTLGAIGYDSEGRRGRVHIVVSRDTLWDISNAYLGTPWVWPSIWYDNENIENPHLIHPGDHIWITPSEMRRVTPEEAAMLLANRPMQDAPAALDETDPTEAAPAPELLAEPVDRGSYRVSSRETAGLITPEQFEASASIVDSTVERVLMSQEDEVYIGLGEGSVEAGDQLTVFRTNVKVFDPDTGSLLGYHVEILGWVEVQETYPETSLAKIGMSTSEVEISDRVMPREPLPADIAIQAGPDDVEGKISFFPNKRVLMGFKDFVYLNRGALDGLEVGSPLVVYRPGRMANEPTRGESVHVPDAVIAQMLVVRAETQSAVALVTHATVELRLGDRFRGAH